MSPSGRAPGASLPFRPFPAGRAAQAFRARSNMVAAAFGPFARKVMSLSALTALGQASFVIALPVLSRLYTPSDFGLFTIYLSIVNIGGPIVGLKFESALYAARTKQEAGITLALSILTITIMPGVAIGGVVSAFWTLACGHVVGVVSVGCQVGGNLHSRDRSPRSTRGDDWNAAGRRAHRAGKRRHSDWRSPHQSRCLFDLYLLENHHLQRPLDAGRESMESRAAARKSPESLPPLRAARADQLSRGQQPSPVASIVV